MCQPQHADGHVMLVKHPPPTGFALDFELEHHFSRLLAPRLLPLFQNSTGVSTGIVHTKHSSPALVEFCTHSIWWRSHKVLVHITALFGAIRQTRVLGCSSSTALSALECTAEGVRKWQWRQSVSEHTLDQSATCRQPPNLPASFGNRVRVNC